MNVNWWASEIIVRMTWTNCCLFLVQSIFCGFIMKNAGRSFRLTLLLISNVCHPLHISVCIHSAEFLLRSTGNNWSQSSCNKFIWHATIGSTTIRLKRTSLPAAAGRGGAEWMWMESMQIGGGRQEEVNVSENNKYECSTRIGNENWSTNECDDYADDGEVNGRQRG